MNKDPLHKQLEGNPAVIVLNFKVSQQYKNVHKRKLGKRTQEYCQDISSAPAPRQWPGGASKKCGGNSGSICRSGTPDGPFVSHLWTCCGNDLRVYSLEAGVSALGDDQQMLQASSLLWPLLNVGIWHTMGFPHIPGSLCAPAALRHGRFCLNISDKRLGAPRAHWCPPTPCSRGGKLLRSQWGRLL